MKPAALVLSLLVAQVIQAQTPLVTTPARAGTPTVSPSFTPTAGTALNQVIMQLNRQQAQLSNAAAITSAQRRNYVPLTVIVRPGK